MSKDYYRTRDFLLKHEKAIVIGGAVTLGALMGIPFDMSNETEIIHTIGHICDGLLCGALLAKIRVVAGTYAKRPILDMPKLIVYTLKSIPTKKKCKNPAKLRQTLEDHQDLFLEHAQLLAQSEIDLLEGNIEAAIDKYEEALPRMPKPQKGLLNRMLMYLSDKYNKQVLKTGKEPRLDQTIMLMEKGLFKQSLDNWRGILEQQGDNIDLQILYGRSLEAMRKDELAMEQWKKVFHMVRDRAANEKGIEFERIEQTDVWKLSESDILDNVFVFKRADRKEELQKELEVTNKSYEKINVWRKSEKLEEKFAASRSIRITKNDYYALVSLYEKGKTLLEYVQKTNDTEKIQETARFLGAIHSIMNDTTKNPRDEANHFNRRMRELEDKLVQEGKEPAAYRAALQMLLESYLVPVEKTSSSPDVFDKDAHGKNWNVSEQGRVTAIDFQDRGSVKPEDDLSKLLEMGDNFPNNTQGDLERDRCIFAYKNEVTKHGRIDLPEASELIFRKLNADLLRAVSFFCFSYGREADKTIRSDYLRNSIHSAKRIQLEYNDKVSSTDLLQYQMFQQGLELLLALEQT